MILMILVSLPMLNITTWDDRVTAYDKSLNLLDYFAAISSTQFDV